MMFRFLESLLILAKVLLTIILSIFILGIGYMAYMNPNINHLIYLSELESQEFEERLKNVQLDIENEKLKEWNYDFYSSIDTKEDKYPIVSLRTGFKVLKIQPEGALVGWSYEVINTSPSTTYTVKIDYKLTDTDDFVIGSSIGEGIVVAEGYRKITGIINIENDDLSRLIGSSWTVLLSPIWMATESKTEGNRYERLEKIVKDTKPLPFWLLRMKKDTLTGFAKYREEKWIAIVKGIWGDTDLKSTDDSSPPKELQE